ncbi:hypothetical protein VitviT2T_029248 [Vitis vinifera]|uniref:Acetyl-CoA acetyltransferase, cytosolic 2 n=1 Tax=Vitis vinifera TaxID=29760 RepID=A0ABY9DWG4_VITVI|nr:hypothetical protein VitviT2T_029248 [Vitis vinifera]
MAPICTSGWRFFANLSNGYAAEDIKHSSQAFGHDTTVDGMAKDGLWDVYNDFGMAICAEICADQHKITREQQDGGSVTAGNASSISDGAAALVLVTGKKAVELRVQVIAKIAGYGDAAQAPELFTTTPALAIPKAISNAGLKASQIDYYEINKAFALLLIKSCGLDPEKVNVHGGSISLGHPIGCSGARILVTLLGLDDSSGIVGCGLGFELLGFQVTRGFGGFSGMKIPPEGAPKGFTGVLDRKGNP